jgi:hypothetical protein
MNEPAAYLIALFAAIFVFELLPFFEELWRGWRRGDRPIAVRTPVQGHAKVPRSV